MRFGTVPVGDCAGTILAHTLKTEGLRLKKGHRISEADVEALQRAGVAEIIALRLDPDDEPEDAAAARLAAAMAVSGIDIGPAATGRANLFAAHNGLFRVDRPAVDAFNRVDPAITLATLADRAQVAAGDMVATVKIIPLAVAGASLDAASKVMAAPGALAVKPFSAKKVGLIATTLPSLKESVMDKTRDLLAARLAPSGSAVTGEMRVAHDADAVAAAIIAMEPKSDLLVVFGASAVADPQDVIPAAIRAAGGKVEAVGMPVDSGNLLVLGTIGGKPVIGAPGCARSPKENGFDWVLARLLAGEAVTRGDIAGMGVGGLLSEIPSRPQPRAAAAAGTSEPLRVEGVLLAAGRASRMGPDGAHKLLAEFDGMPLVRRVADEALRAPLAAVHVVVGHRSEAVAAALAGLDVHLVENPAFASGMASSLDAGIAALSPQADGAIVLLADMPAITHEHLATLVAAFQGEGGRAVVRAAYGDKRGNPVILPRATFAAIHRLSGDVGARQIVETSGLAIVDVDIGAAAQLDVDTPEAVLSAGGVLKA